MRERNHSVITKAALNIIKPLVRLLIKHDIAHSEFSEIAKQAYVDVAYEKFTIPKRKMTFSRVAILTGLSRKEVVRLKEESTLNTPHIKKTYNRASRVITGWLSDAQFLDDNKHAKVLPLKHSDNEGSENSPSFALLVERYSGDITAGAILDELLNKKLVSQLDNSDVCLNCVGYVPQSEELEQIDILSACSRNLLNSGIHNIEKAPEEAAFFQRQLSHGLPEDLVKKFQSFSQKKSLELLLEFNRWIGEEKSQHELSPDDTTKRVGLGIYYFEEDETKRDI